MLSFLIKNGFYFTNVETKENIEIIESVCKKILLMNFQIITTNDIKKLIVVTKDIKNVLM